nr:hypothetical protein CFP56_30149 [Quercus suber]
MPLPRIDALAKDTLDHRSCTVEVQRTDSKARHVGRAVDGIEQGSSPLEVGCGNGSSTATKLGRVVLSRELVECASHTGGSTAELAVGDVGAVLTDADEAVGFAGVGTKGDRIKLVLGKDLASDKRNRVWVNARVPVRRQLLLLEKIIHGSLVGLS